MSAKKHASVFLSSLFIQALIPALAAATPLPRAAQPDAIRFDELATYYSEQSQGAIRPSLDPALIPQPLRNLPQSQIEMMIAGRQQGLRFRLTPHMDYASISSTPYLDASNSQRLFQLDVAGFTASRGARNFLEAKRDYYSQLRFNDDTQRHQRPYAYMKDWGELFHPPVRRLTLPLEAYTSSFPVDFNPAASDSGYFDSWFQQEIDAVSGSSLTSGNQLRMLVNGESFLARLKLIREAQHSLYFVNLAFFCDHGGRQLLDALIERKRAGVDVRFITDGTVGLVFSGQCLRALSNAGIPVVKIYDAMNTTTLTAVFHQKYWIRDAEEMIIGGQNIVDLENFSDGFNFKDRDTDVWVRGPVVTDTLRNFMDKWRQYGGIPAFDANAVALAHQKRTIEEDLGLRGSGNYAGWLGSPSTRMKGLCRVIEQGALALPHPMARTLTKYIEKAKTQIFVTTPDTNYSATSTENPNHQGLMVEAMKARAERGVETLILTNGVDGGSGELAAWIRQWREGHIQDGEQARADFANEAYRSETIAAARDIRHVLVELQKTPNIQAWNYMNYYHAKQYMFDRTVVFIGSLNLDDNSVNLAHETGILCMDDSLRRQMEKQLTLDLVNSTPVVSKNGL